MMSSEVNSCRNIIAHIKKISHIQVCKSFYPQWRYRIRIFPLIIKGRSTWLWGCNQSQLSTGIGDILLSPWILLGERWRFRCLWKQIGLCLCRKKPSWATDSRSKTRRFSTQLACFSKSRSRAVILPCRGFRPMGFLFICQTRFRSYQFSRKMRRSRFSCSIRTKFLKMSWKMSSILISMPM